MEMTHELCELIRILYRAGIEYTHSDRYCVRDHCRAHNLQSGLAEVAGYETHGQIELTPAQEDLLRDVLGFGDQ